MVKFGHKSDAKMKAMLRETRKRYREPIVMGRKLALKSMVWKRKTETFNQNRMKKQEFKKMRRGLGMSGTTLKVPISES